jgi:hypothetical protein
MKHGRKTIEVEKVKKLVNKMLLNSRDDNRSGRATLQTLIETILFDTGNYNGFNYLTPHDMARSENGTTYGIDYGKDCDHWFDDTDHTRVFYY